MSTISDAKSADPIDMIDESSSIPSSRARRDLERRLVRKLDLRMSVIVLLNALNFVDRSNASSARLAGLEQDLHLQGQQYATILSIVYVGYILMQLPANMFLHWLERPAILIPSTMVIWGVISTLTGITKNYTGIFLARFFLGFAEGPFVPGVLFLISGWYKRDELAVRTTLVSCGSVLSAGFGAVFASGILSGMQGTLGQAAWRWLFYIEGSATVLVAICAMFLLPDFPHNTKWLTPEERTLAISRLAEDGYGRPGDLTKRTTMQGLWDAVSDWKVWWLSLALFIQFVSLSFVIYFPTIVATLGYDTSVTLLLVAPPWVLSTITSFALSRYSDKKRKRYIYVVASSSTAALGFIISLCTMNTTARYISMFLMAQISAGQMVLWGWMANTFAREPAKRAAAIAMINGLAQAGNIVGSFVWPINWGPSYRYSYAICFAALGVSTAMFGVMYLHLKRLNERMERDEQDTKELQGPVGFRYLV
ncbi:major facilitator superfamily domain-containing protein [Suillus paluster]|uniref:major facilitator superfamily domain-containing protein n=1 Tax=Suillus paluster TaxID=48578 RepID=UPI001B86BCED|nr:major facilitator superfamily domain-containing protein [Suillus paluster]KAG1739088.1 major facilitator superfamily domain-containing protein [Suillus paluster]